MDLPSLVFLRVRIGKPGSTARSKANGCGFSSGPSVGLRAVGERVENGRVIRYSNVPLPEERLSSRPKRQQSLHISDNYCRCVLISSRALRGYSAWGDKLALKRLRRCITFPPPVTYPGFALTGKKRRQYICSCDRGCSRIFPEGYYPVVSLTLRAGVDYTN